MLLKKKDKAKKGKKKSKKKKSKPEKAENKNKQSKKGGGNFRAVMDFLPGILSTFGKFQKKLCIDELTIHYFSADTDPYKAALTFGASSSGMGILVPLLENFFTVKKLDFQSGVDFNNVESTIYLSAKLTIAIWQVVWLANGFAVFCIKTIITNKGKVKFNG